MVQDGSITMYDGDNDTTGSKWIGGPLYLVGGEGERLRGSKVIGKGKCCQLQGGCAYEVSEILRRDGTPTGNIVLKKV